jgi:hypothetical protein
MDKFDHKLSVKMEGADEKIIMELAVNLTGLNLDNFTYRGLKDFAANSAKVVRDGDKTAAEFTAEFQELVEKYSRGEKTQREGGGRAAVDSTETLAIRILASVLKDKNGKGELATAKTPVPRVDDPPVTEKGAINFNAWAKLCREAEHPWYAVAKKQAEQKKGFE